MENELTPRLQIPYSKVRPMDENGEINAAPEPKVSEEAEDEILRRAQQMRTRRQRAVQEAWEELNRQKEERGEKVTDEEREIQKRAIEKGIPPQIGGAGDGGYFENFPAEKFQHARLKELGNELRNLGSRNEVNDDRLRDIQQEVRNLVGVGSVPQGEGDEFDNEINKVIVAKRAGQPYEAQQAPERPLGIEDVLQSRLDYALAKKENRSSNPRSIQEMALSIINDDGLDRWGPKGPFPLLSVKLDENKRPLTRRNTQGETVPQLELNRQNFIRWFRERMMYHHINNSRDETLQLGNLVGITSEFGSTISIFSMDKDRAQYFRDENANSEEDAVMDGLADQMKMELWLFGNMRNYDLLYQKYMGSDSDLPKFLAQLHDKEEITQPASLQTIMSLPENFGVEGDTAVGDSIRKAYEIYYYASDLKKLQEVLGENSIFFKKEGFMNAFRVIENLGPDASFGELSKQAQSFINEIFNEEKIIDNKFMTAMNPFNVKNKEEFNKRIIREMVRQTLSAKYGLDNGLDPETVPLDAEGKPNINRRNLVRKDLEYAEAFAWVLTRWTGAAARNDTSAIGFDAFTKTIKFRDYRKRQSADTRAGAFGNEYDLPVFKGLTVDFFNGITVEKKFEDGSKNLTPFEVFRMLDKKEDDLLKSINDDRSKKGLSTFETLAELDKKLLDTVNARRTARGEERLEILPKLNTLVVESGDQELGSLIDTKKKIISDKDTLAKRLNFEQYIQRSYSADHINRGFEVFHSMMGAEELKLEEIVKRDPFQGVILDRGKFEEQVKEKFIKPIRYAFSTYGQLDMGKMTRVQIKGFNSGEMPVYEDKTVAESLFGPEVTNSLRPKAQVWFDTIKADKKEKFINSYVSNKGERFSELSNEDKKEAIWQGYVSDPSTEEGGRAQLWKRAVMARIALQLKSHRFKGNGYLYFDEAMVNKFYEALETIKSVDINEEDESTDVTYAKRFLTPDDIKWIREMSKTTQLRLFMTDILVGGAGVGAIKGAWNGLGSFVNDLFK